MIGAELPAAFAPEERDLEFLEGSAGVGQIVFQRAPCHGRKAPVWRMFEARNILFRLVISPILARHACV